jgi:[ribosomal protein S5]-alanine N-acetyltransferase
MADNSVEQPQMFGERIWLRPIELRDALVLSQSTQDVEGDWVPHPNPPVSEIAFRNWIQTLDATELVWAVCRTDQQEVIGTASIRSIDLRHRVAETGMGLLYPEDQGQGLGQEIKTLILDFAFDVMGLHSVRCIIDSRNAQSQRSVEKSGYIRAGHLTSDIPAGLGTYANTIVYQMLAPEWKVSRQG